MPANERTWTTERLELLKSRFEAGLSCREIANHIGVSRNAFIGKLSRLNLTREKSGDARRVGESRAGRRGACGLRNRVGLRAAYCRKNRNPQARGC